MLLVPLLAASEFKCQLNAYNFVTVTECFYERVLDRQGASRGTGVPPSALGSLSSWSVWQLLWVWQCCAAQPRCPGVLTFWMWLCAWACVCVCVHQHLLGCGPGAQTGSSSTQTNILYHSLVRRVCAWVRSCECMFLCTCLATVCVTNILTLYALCAHHLHWGIVLPRRVKVCFCADSQLALHLVIALDHTGIKFGHYVSQLISGHVRTSWTNVSSSAKSDI